MVRNIRLMVRVATEGAPPDVRKGNKNMWFDAEGAGISLSVSFSLCLRLIVLRAALPLPYLDVHTAKQPVAYPWPCFCNDTLVRVWPVQVALTEAADGPSIIAASLLPSVRPTLVLNRL